MLIFFISYRSFHVLLFVRDIPQFWSDLNGGEYGAKEACDFVHKKDSTPSNIQFDSAFDQ